MDPAGRNPRDMTDEEAIKWMQELIDKLTAENGQAGGACSLEALRNPVRRRILDLLEERPLEMDEISRKTGVAGSVLRYHLSLLKSSCFIEMKGDTVDLTPGGVSVVRSHRRT